MDVLIWDGDITWQGDDIMLSEGTSDKIQRAYLETITDKGESVFYPEYGSKVYQRIGRIVSDGNRELLKQELAAVFADIDDITVTDITITEVDRGWQVYVKFINLDGTVEDGLFLVGGEELYGVANEG